MFRCVLAPSLSSVCKYHSMVVMRSLEDAARMRCSIGSAGMYARMAACVRSMPMRFV